GIRNRDFYALCRCRDRGPVSDANLAAYKSALHLPKHFSNGGERAVLGWTLGNLRHRKLNGVDLGRGKVRLKRDAFAACATVIMQRSGGLPSLRFLPSCTPRNLRAEVVIIIVGHRRIILSNVHRDISAVVRGRWRYLIRACDEQDGKHNERCHGSHE